MNYNAKEKDKSGNVIKTGNKSGYSKVTRSKNLQEFS